MFSISLLIFCLHDLLITDREVELSNYNYEFVCFSFLFHQFLLHAFLSLLLDTDVFTNTMSPDELPSFPLLNTLIILDNNTYSEMYYVCV